MRAIAILLLITLVGSATAADIALVGTWRGRLTGTAVSQTLTPQRQILDGPVTLVVWRIAIGNPDQDGRIITELTLGEGSALPIGGDPANGWLSATAMSTPEPVGRTWGASSTTFDGSMVLTLAGQVLGKDRLVATGLFVTSHAVDQFMLTARRYTGPVDGNGYPLAEVPTGLALRGTSLGRMMQVGIDPLAALTVATR